MKKKYIPYLLMLPIMIYTLLLIIYPLIFSAVLAFKKFDPISGLSLLNMKTVGWKNFSRNFGDNAFYESLFNTIEMVVIGVIVQFLFSFLLALALNKKTTLYTGTALTLILTPLVMPMVASGLTWRMLFHIEYGAINGIITSLGFDSINFLGDPSLVRFSIILVDTWQWTPLMTLILFAGLKALPEEIMEASKVDGANSLSTLFFITIPLLRWPILVALLIRITDSWKMFDYVDALTGGGPGYSSQTLSYYVYIKGFRRFELGEAASVSWIMLIIIYVVCFLLVKILKPKAGESF
jgi:multiple sugar transport system permease protein|tara:strand:+ start:5400 stop:6284 length:885 start_codon:yes stop_codon:yes gene_type:complete